MIITILPDLSKLDKAKKNMITDISPIRLPLYKLRATLIKQVEVKKSCFIHHML